MKKSNVEDKRRFTLEDMNKKDFIPLFGGRPERMTVIQHDDIVNLSIMLNTTVNVDELIKKV